MPKKVLVVYYTQTGQLRDIVSSITAPLAAEDDVTLVFEELKPKPAFPFPWTADQFFQAMPESVKGIPCELEPLAINGEDNFDLVIVAWQPWFLSPSIPIHAFFQLETAKKLISGKPVITIIGSRNMWVMAQKRIKKYIADTIPFGGKCGFIRQGSQPAKRHFHNPLADQRKERQIFGNYSSRRDIGRGYCFIRPVRTPHR
jgi:hypothetical protein